MSDSVTTTDSITISHIDTACGHQIGIVTLNAPKSLNALSTEMCTQLSTQLEAWRTDARIKAVLLQGAGDKAFCAGGDIRKLYESMCQTDTLPNPYATQFFGQEYTLYLQMHRYPKPLILWGDGIIMGGGMGLMAACSHRIVTERTRFAMPEVTIGLFPDATGSWFLQRMPAKTGLFLGLTGAHCNGADAIFGSLAEYSTPHDAYNELLSALQQADWRTLDKRTGDVEGHDTHAHEVCAKLLSTLPTVALPESRLSKYWQTIQRLMSIGGLAQIDALLHSDDALQALDSDFADDTWTQRAVATYRHGCPVTKALTYAMYQRAGTLSLAQILYLETNMAVHCAHYPDFKEGVRALLIDKDKQPIWSRSLADCLTPEGQDYIRSHFDNPYLEDTHPLLNGLKNDSAALR